MTRREFHNGLRVLMNIDKWELEVTLGGEVSTPMWERFRDNPWQWFIKAPDSQAEAVFKVVEARNVAAKLTVNTCARCGGAIDPHNSYGNAGKRYCSRECVRTSFAGGPDTLETLHDCEEYFDQRMDTEDGPNGGVYPNAEMRLLTGVQAAIAQLEKEGA